MHDVPNHPGAEVPLFLTGSIERAEGKAMDSVCVLPGPHVYLKLYA